MHSFLNKKQILDIVQIQNSFSASNTLVHMHGIVFLWVEFMLSIAYCLIRNLEDNITMKSA